MYFISINFLWMFSK